VSVPSQGCELSCICRALQFIPALTCQPNRSIQLQYVFIYALNEIEDAYSLEFELDPIFYKAELLLVFFFCHCTRLFYLLKLVNEETKNN